MTAVQLRILNPVNDTAVIGSQPVACSGEIMPPAPPELSGVQLFFRWYSSLFPSAENRYSINPAALNSPADPFTPTLKVGTHAISLAASDQAGEDQDAQNATRHGGMAGGSEGDGRCLVHVFQANMVYPAVNGTILQQSQDKLEAEAPLKWGSRLKNSDPWAPDTEYHKHNRLQYRWEFVPLGNPAGRNTANLIPGIGALTFDPSGPVPILRYQGALPAGLSGNYTLNLYVEDKDAAANLGSHKASRTVTVQAPI